MVCTIPGLISLTNYDLCGTFAIRAVEINLQARNSVNQWIWGDGLFACPVDIGEAVKNSLKSEPQLHLCDSGP